MKAKYFIGYDGTKYHLCLADHVPTAEQYGAAMSHFVGPFRTKRGAVCMIVLGRGNPHIQHVDDAELIGRKYASELAPACRKLPVTMLTLA